MWVDKVAVGFNAAVHCTVGESAAIRRSWHVRRCSAFICRHEMFGGHARQVPKMFCDFLLSQDVFFIGVEMLEKAFAVDTVLIIG